MYLSRYIIRSKHEYHRRLRAVTVEGRWDAWIGYMLAGIAATAYWTMTRIDALRELERRALAHLAQRQTAAACLREPVEIGVLTAQRAGEEKSLPASCLPAAALRRAAYGSRPRPARPLNATSA